METILAIYRCQQKQNKYKRANESSVKTHVCAFARGQCPVVFFNVDPVEGVKV